MGLRENLFPCLFQLVETAHSPWLMPLGGENLFPCLFQLVETAHSPWLMPLGGWVCVGGCACVCVYTRSCLTL